MNATTLTKPNVKSGHVLSANTTMLSQNRRKRKMDAVTCEIYANKVSELEQMESLVCDLTAKQIAKCRKEKRTIKNRLSALKSREKKRIKLETLQGEALDLQRQVEILNQANRALRHPLHAGMLPSVPLHVGVRQTTNAPNKRQTSFSCTRKRNQAWPSCASSRDNYSPAFSRKLGIPSHPSILHEPNPFSQMQSCVCSAPRPRSSVSSVIKQYSCMPWDLPWETLGSIFWSLGKLSLALIANQTDRSAVAEYVQRQQFLRRIFCQIWMSFSRKQSYPNELRYDRERNRQDADTMFNRISRKFLSKAASKQHAIINHTIPLTHHIMEPRTYMY